MKNTVNQNVKNLIKQALEKTGISYEEEIQLEHPGEEGYGDFSCNTALKLEKKLAKNSLEIAKEIVKNINKNYDIEKIEIANPGFINFFLSNKFFINNLSQIITEKDRYGSSQNGKGKTVVIDYSAPNIAKPFGIGHLRSTIIGQAIYNLYKFSGYTVIGDNHLGDWGTQFGKLMYQIKKKGVLVSSLTIADLEKLYVEFHKDAEVNPKLEDEGRAWFKKLENGDKEARKMWQECVNISLKEFNKIYDLLDIKIDYAYGESFYEDKMLKVIQEAKNRKLTVMSDSAWVIKFPHDKLPSIILVKSDGGSNYLTRDLATVAFRKKTWNPSLYIYEVGADQALYFQQLFSTVELFGWEKKKKFVHVKHGLIRFEHGKMSTRKGETIHLEEVLNEAIQKAKKIIEDSKTSEGELKERGLSSKEKEKVAEAVGIGAIKYNDLMQFHEGDIIFKWEKVLNLQGNSGPYLQYTYARTQNVSKKVNNYQFDKEIVEKYKLNSEETLILRTLYKFPEVVKQATRSFSPNLICSFLYDLAQKYNLFYNKCSILKAENKKALNARLAINFAVGQILKNGLTLLGIKVLDKM